MYDILTLKLPKDYWITLRLSNINTTMLSSFSTSYFAILIIILTLGIYVSNPMNFMDINTRKILFVLVYGTLIFFISFNLWYHHCHKSQKEKQLAEHLLNDIIVNHKFNTVAS